MELRLLHRRGICAKAQIFSYRLSSVRESQKNAESQVSASLVVTVLLAMPTSFLHIMVFKPPNCCHICILIFEFELTLKRNAVSFHLCEILRYCTMAHSLVHSLAKHSTVLHWAYCGTELNNLCTIPQIKPSQKSHKCQYN